MRIGEVGEGEALGFFVEEMGAVEGAIEEGEFDALIDFVHGLLAEEATDGLAGRAGGGPFEFGDFLADGRENLFVVGIEDVEGEAAVFLEMVGGGAEGGELVGDGVHVLERAKRHDDERKFFLHAEAAHVGGVEVDTAADGSRFGSETLFENAEHGRGSVEAVNFEALAGDGEQDAAGAAADFENRTKAAAGEIEIEGDVNQVGLGGVGGVVVLSGNVIAVHVAIIPQV